MKIKPNLNEAFKNGIATIENSSWREAAAEFFNKIVAFEGDKTIINWEKFLIEKERTIGNQTWFVAGHFVDALIKTEILSYARNRNYEISYKNDIGFIEIVTPLREHPLLVGHTTYFVSKEEADRYADAYEKIEKQKVEIYKGIKER